QYLTRTRQVSKLETLGLGLVAGGALGNAIDRLMLGYVVDFIATDFIDFPVFNVADIGICVGVFFAFVGFMFLSPAAKVDATAELNARDEAAAARREKRRAERVRRARAASNAQGGDTARPEGEDVPADGGDA
ncbi:MAG: signal peptidase II, partial [Collinsella intestinalis]